ncbi:hypothetical protein B0H17DRAFT_1212089 [Mycena rosella]|uniref:Uncharacterized protein n=1 Tax=Mycena rosella TaxID=1033263 RepID=A0AAD7CTU3_MYCRO|nr:hypothetical protein B0H17DRAFT_1212089 [Mycena rosella]
MRVNDTATGAPVRVNAALVRVSARRSRHFYQTPSMIWPALGSASHGPVYHQEPAATLAALDSWHTEILTQSQYNSTPIFLSIKIHRRLLMAAVPTVYVCRDDITWARFRQAFIDYEKSRTDLVLPRSRLPHVSGPSPIRMNTSGHKKFLSKVSGYKHGVDIFTEDQLNLAHELGLS